tara:strand:- start:5305 stop:5655 length:351 start_codon:yes stop_codon:yes gene_type:complete
MEITGTIKFIDKTNEVGSNNFRKRDIVVTTDEQYPQDILVQFVQDKCDILNNYAVGQGVKVSINLRGREWVNPEGETKYFNTIQGWKIEHTGKNANASQDEPVDDINPDDGSDLAF